MLHQKHEPYKYVLPLKNWVYWINTMQEKNFLTSKLENIFTLMTTFYNFTPKIETIWAKKGVKSILQTWNVNDFIVYV